jgi:hypothetical protein
MRTYSLSHLGDPELHRGLLAAVAQDHSTTAILLAYLAEFDARKLYLPAGYPSMYAYCVEELRLSEDAACNRIRAARLAQRFPALFEAVADGRLHLGAIGLLAPYLTPENADELLAAATHRTKAEIEALLAQRFPRSEAMGLVCALPASAPAVVGHWPRGQLRPLYPPRGGWRSRPPVPGCRRWPPSASPFRSRSGGALMTSSSTRGTCSATGSPRET